MSASFDNNLVTSNTSVQNRIIALWALSEAGLGGVLHLLKVPFSGIVVVGLSVFLVSLLAFFSKGAYRSILKATIIVLLIKMAVSPYSPAPAYIAVWFQGILGWALFSVFRFNSLTIVIYGVLAILESAFQKLLVLTIYFGMSIWDSINIFTDYVLRQFGHQGHAEMTKWLLSLYLSIYILGSLFFAYMTIRVIKTITHDAPGLAAEFGTFRMDQKKLDKKKKLIGKRTWLGLILLFIISIMIFINPLAGWEQAIFVFLRTVVIILAWYLLIAPIIKRFFEQMLKKEKKKFADEVSNIIDSFPELKSIASFAWQKYQPLKGINNFEQFLSAIIYLSLNINESEK